MTRNNRNSISLKNKDKALSKQESDRIVDRAIQTLMSKLGKDYVRGLDAQTRGSHRKKRANSLGLSLVPILNLMRDTEAEQGVVGYIERARRRTRLAAKRHRGGFGRNQRVALAALLLERIAFDNILKLDEMEALAAITRVRRCARCGSWFWARVRAQRYCRSSCRVRHYQSSPEGKRYKREWAREDYRRNKKRDEKALESAMDCVRRARRIPRD